MRLRSPRFFRATGASRTTRARRSISTVLAAAALTLLAVGGATSAQADSDAIPQESPQTYVVGGHDASMDYPYTISMQQPNGSHHCVGVLIAPDWMVTAGHCVNGHQPGDYQYRMATADRTTGGVVVGADAFYPHPNYTPRGANYDIALVHLSQAVDVGPVPMASTSPGVGTPARLLGWGQTCPTEGCGQPSQTLQEVDSWVLDDSACTTRYGNIDGPSELCVASPNGTAACYGDSGGPALVASDGVYYLVGTTSRGTGRNCAAGPSIYTDIAAYRSWIMSTTGMTG